MNSSDDIAVLRARDFWGAVTLGTLSIFFLWRTSYIPLFGKNRGGVTGGDWYNSAALVPFGIFTGLLTLSLVLLGISVKSGGARLAFSAAGLGWDKAEAIRFSTLGLIMFFYIVGLVPRVDFILCSGLLITALIFGFHGGQQKRMVLSSAAVATAGGYALFAHLPRSEWALHFDDWVTLSTWAVLAVVAVSRSPRDKIARATPILSVLVPLVLVLAMAFGFRQNVPNRGGLVFEQIEYHYYVTLKPLWSR
ncbi:hypothetical protein [Shimia sp.]|uniref:hypothetical protein n=1 Tax=Shimia sp. TaxID=1954381 RepID=UPI003B8BF731